VGLVSREQVTCPSGRRGKPGPEARKLARIWPFREEVLRVEVSSAPQPALDEPGMVRTQVRVHTQVSEDMR
jgi:hypothetical protein